MTHVVGLDEITGKHLSGSDTTVVRTLRTRETHLGPSIHLSIGVKQGVLLLQTEPRHVLLDRVHDFRAVCTVVGLVDGAVIVVAFTEDEDVVAATEGVFEHGNGALSQMSATMTSARNDTQGIVDDSRGRRQSCHLVPARLMIHQSSTLSTPRQTSGFSRKSWSCIVDHQNRRSRCLGIVS